MNTFMQFEKNMPLNSKIVGIRRFSEICIRLLKSAYAICIRCSVTAPHIRKSHYKRGQEAYMQLNALVMVAG